MAGAWHGVSLTCPFVHLPLCPDCPCSPLSVHPAVCASSCLSATCPSTHVTGHPSIHCSVQIPPQPTLPPPTHPSTHPSIHPSLRPSICPPTHPSIHPPTHPSLHPSLHPFIPPSAPPSPHPLSLPPTQAVCHRPPTHPNHAIPFSHRQRHLPAVCPCGAGSACTASGECCHAECLGGCGRPRDSRSCVACRHFHFNGHCLPSCPPRTYEYEGWRCITAEYCASLRKVSDNPRDASKFVIHQQQCLSECPPGYTRNESRWGPPPWGVAVEGGGSVPGLHSSLCPCSIFCHKCEGLCPKACKVGTKTVDSTRAAQELAGCTLVEGNLILNIRRGCECWEGSMGHRGEFPLEEESVGGGHWGVRVPSVNSIAAPCSCPWDVPR